ncbi:hypothetical protein Y032_0312g2169 [Ancylostoma ceylanicum]|uniref:Uncharacterized protein n=1 Tax=Ancylostoma ceylanicum TaxID=53326 RepID=A0A016S337_9BILA|nr:hypothetical protein Y032_0312g2169 [Ancylostoma ceylanicum]
MEFDASSFFAQASVFIWSTAVSSHDYNMATDVGNFEHLDAQNYFLALHMIRGSQGLKALSITSEIEPESAKSG